MDETTHTEQGSGLSRRTMLKGVGIGTAVAWTAPAVLSVSGIAHADGSLTGPCKDKFTCGNSAFCGANQQCLCTATTEGDLFCSDNFSCDQVPTCTTSADCPAGQACQSDNSGCCGPGVCLPACSDTQSEKALQGKTNKG
jgi:hypothetical protein